jgi:DNA-binding IclR family transcriptional regulator
MEVIGYAVWLSLCKQSLYNCIRHTDVTASVVSLLVSSAVDRGFAPRSSQTKHYEIGICCFSAMQAALRRTSKDWLSRNQNNVSEWSDMSTRGLLFQ